MTQRSLLVLLISRLPLAGQSTRAYLDPDLSIEQRSRDLVSRLTLDEKIGQRELRQ